MTTPIDESRAAVRAALAAVESALTIAQRNGDADEVCARLRLVRTTLGKAANVAHPDYVPEGLAPMLPDGAYPEDEGNADQRAEAFGRLAAGYKLPARPAPPATTAAERPIIQGRNVYGEPFDAEMMARAKRENIAPADVRRAIIAVRHYAVRGYVVALVSGSLVAFTKRRDGKVQMAMVSPASVLSSEAM